MRAWVRARVRACLRAGVWVLKSYLRACKRAGGRRGGRGGRGGRAGMPGVAGVQRAFVRVRARVHAGLRACGRGGRF